MRGGKWRDLHSDRNFGDMPGLEVTVTIGHLGGGQLVSDSINALMP